MKFALLFLLSLPTLLSCQTSNVVNSTIYSSSFSHTTKAFRVGAEKNWYVYKSDKYTAYLNEDAGKNALIMVPDKFHNKSYQFKKTYFTIYDYYNTAANKEGQFVVKATDPEGTLYKYLSWGIPQIGYRYEVWIPR